MVWGREVGHVCGLMWMLEFDCGRFKGSYHRPCGEREDRVCRKVIGLGKFGWAIFGLGMCYFYFI